MLVVWYLVNINNLPGELRSCLSVISKKVGKTKIELELKQDQQLIKHCDIPGFINKLLIVFVNTLYLIFIYKDTAKYEACIAKLCNISFNLKMFSSKCSFVSIDLLMSFNIENLLTKSEIVMPWNRWKPAIFSACQIWRSNIHKYPLKYCQSNGSIY